MAYVSYDVERMDDQRVSGAFLPRYVTYIDDQTDHEGDLFEDAPTPRIPSRPGRSAAGTPQDSRRGAAERSLRNDPLSEQLDSGYSGANLLQ